MKQTLTLFFICTITFFACQQSERITPVLTLAEKLMIDRPDSALALLDSVPFPEKCSKHEYATWCLLITQARDKNYVEHTSDSLISIAVDYFDKKKDVKRKALAYYYKGRVNDELGMISEALGYYLKARDYVKETDDYNLQGLILMYIGNLQWKFVDYQNALANYNDSYAAFLKDENMVSSAYLLRDIGRVYSEISQPDSAETYFKRALAVAVLTNKKSLQGNIESDLAIAYGKVGRYQEALKYAYASMSHTVKPQFIYSNYFMIGNLFYKTEQMDSAYYYTKKALDSNYLYTLAGAHDLLASIYRKRNDFQRADSCLSAYIDYRDLIKEKYDTPKLKELELRYNAERTEHENERLLADKKIMKLFFVAGCCLGLFFMLLGYLIYQKRLRHKERSLQQALEAVRVFQEKYVIYQKEIEAKELQIDVLTKSIREKEKTLPDQEGVVLALEGAEDTELSELYQKISNLKNDVSVLSKKNSGLMDMLLSGTDLRAAVEESVEKNQSMTPELWLGIQRKLKEIDPEFMRKIRKAAPTLKLKELQLCCLIKLNVPASQIAILQQWDKRTISRYKSIIVKERFGRQENELLDTLLCRL